jgi:hypothetical protein
MDQKDDTNGIGRRSFLRTTAAGLLAASVPAGSAAARERTAPITATGKRIHRFVPDGDQYRHFERFVSQDLQPHFGQATIEYDPITVPSDRVPETVKKSNGTGVVNYRDTGVFGTFDQHANAEKKLRGKKKKANGPSTASHSPNYYGPLYTYKSADIAERTAPVNVAWRRYLGLSASEVRSRMINDANWGTIIPSGDRYVLYYDGSSYVNKKQDRHIKESTGTTDQWHGRLYDIPNADEEDFGVIAQAHHDPWDHGYLGDPDWRFADSRQKFLETWESIGYYYSENQDVYNGYDFDSSDGFLGIVY